MTQSKLRPKFKIIQLRVIITEINSLGKCNELWKDLFNKELIENKKIPLIMN